jgi:hypothetical protein
MVIGSESLRLEQQKFHSFKRADESRPVSHKFAPSVRPDCLPPIDPIPQHDLNVSAMMGRYLC